MFALAKRYASGDGIEFDMGAAGSCALVAADMGQAEAASWLERQAARSPLARLYFGALLSVGPAALRNPTRARESYDSALQELRTLAGQGDATGLYGLGTAYENGYGVQVDDREAFRWYERAAKKGHAEAAAYLSAAYSKGEGVAKDEKLALQYARQAAEAGSVLGQFNYALSLDNGVGIAKNEGLAFAYYQKAAEGGMPNAQNNLASMFEHGRGTPRDLAAARKWFERGAAQGEASALYNLGRCYDEGLGGARDPEQARKLWKESAEKGWPAAKERLALLAERENCLAHAETKLFDVAIACANRDELRSAVTRAGGKPVRVDDEFRYDRYASDSLLRGSSELALGYSNTLFLRAVYKLTPNDEVAQRIVGALTSKYGKPKSERQIDGQTVQYPRLTWKRPDGIQIQLLRAESAMMLIYEHSARNTQLEKEEKESEEIERQRAIQRESKAL